MWQMWKGCLTMRDFAASVFQVFCHQIPDRSFKYAGEIAPVCARCQGLYLGMGCVFIFLILCRFRRIQPSFPRWIHVGLGIGFAACAIDGLFGISHQFDSGNCIRYILGLLAGSAILCWTYHLISDWFVESRGPCFVERSGLILATGISAGGMIFLLFESPLLFWSLVLCCLLGLMASHLLVVAVLIRFYAKLPQYILNRKGRQLR